VYVTLGRMERKGYIASRLQDASPPSGGLRRRLYAPTPFGRRALAASTAWAHVAERLSPEFAR
jgi:DNA-binding PadR family transcriptional regulator